MDYVVLVEPEGPGNIGSVARVMKNFGFRNLVLVNPCEINLETRKYAMHAWDIVENAIILNSFDEIFSLDTDFFVGTTAKVYTDNNTTRAAITPRELASKAKDTSLAFIFGRESSGLKNEELRRCDLVLNIPTSEEYRAMNLSHSVAIVLYEIFLTRREIREPSQNRREVERLLSAFQELAFLPDLGLRNPENAVKMFRNVISRALIKGREAQGILVVLNRALELIESRKP